jgi:hypothetical protein
VTFVGVCGGRDYRNYERLSKVMWDNVVGVRATEVIVHGDAPGADSLADQWARRNGFHVVRIPAHWDENAHRAGPMRNAVIAALPLAKLIAFPGGHGTADMVAKARAAGIPVVEVPR